MKVVSLAGVALLLLVCQAGATERFAPGNPTFAEFEASCRSANSMIDDCKGSVLGAFAEKAKTKPDSVKCDFGAFWKVVDAQRSKLTAVLPWQYGVEAVVREPGVCQTVVNLGL